MAEKIPARTFPTRALALRKKSAPYNMYHPAPAVKREHFRHIKSHRCIALSGTLQIVLRCKDQPLLFGGIDRSSREGQRNRAILETLPGQICSIGVSRRCRILFLV